MIRKTLLLASLLVVSSSIYSMHHADSNFPQLFSDFETYGHLRARGELVDTDASESAGRAGTTQLRVGVKANNVLDVEGLSATFEANHVDAWIDEYNDGSGNKDGYATILDPELTTLTQGFLQYDRDYYSVKLGDQLIMLDDHRFFGNVGWRQTPQSFSALTTEIRPNDKTTIFLGFGNKRYTILGEEQDYRNGLGLININYKPNDKTSVSPFVYMIQDTHDTYGITAKGWLPIDEHSKVGALVTYATQGEASLGDNPTDIDADFLRVKAYYKKKGLKLFVETTQYGADTTNDTSFTTPFATLHKFDGWADQFVGIASSGAEDGLNSTKIGTSYKTKHLGKLYLAYLLYESNEGGNDYGNEINISHGYHLTKHTHILSKVALYNASDDYGSDTSKYIVQLTQNF